MRYGRKVVTAGLVLALAAPAAALAPLGAGVAHADPATDLESAAAQLETLGAQLSQAQDELSSTTTDLEQTEYAVQQKQQEIEQAQAELAEKQAKLGDEMREAYKSGTQGTLELILGSSSVEDLVSRVYYLDKESSARAQAISETRSLEARLSTEMADLEATRQEQNQKIGDLQSQTQSYEDQLAQATALYESLDAEEKARIAAEQESNANIAAAVQTVQTQPEATPGQSGGTGTEESGGAGSEPSASQPSKPAQKPETGGGAGSGSGSGSAQAGQGVSTAYAMLGKPYVWGATGPNAFDCSGLVNYCFGGARGRTTYDMIDSLKASGDWVTSVSELKVGDLVFPHSGHVGIYVGDGYYIHAANPSRGVVKDKIGAFMGGGSYY